MFVSEQLFLVFLLVIKYHNHNKFIQKTQYNFRRNYLCLLHRYVYELKLTFNICLVEDFVTKLC